MTLDDDDALRRELLDKCVALCYDLSMHPEQCVAAVLRNDERREDYDAWVRSLSPRQWKRLLKRISELASDRHEERIRKRGRSS